MNILPTKRNTSSKKSGKKVFVGLSGGVDSAVSAALLKTQGFDVTGVFIKVWQPDWLSCTWREERRDAMKVALQLDIPFLFFDFEEEYKAGVVDHMISEYKLGRTPNPDVLCNREIKFGSFWKKAREMGAHYIATGHYARNEFEKLHEGRDLEKDQSYFLWTLTQDDLLHTIFPVGGMAKEDVRRLAKKFGLPVSEKKDSQGICFMGEVSMEEFLSHYVKTKPGKVLNVRGEEIGKHKGALFYTIGERHGFEITEKSHDERPFYVTSKDMKANTITVSNDIGEIIYHSPRRIQLSDVNWITEPEGPDFTARIRYRGEKVRVNLALEKNKLVVEFEEGERGLSMGQSIVFYDGEIVLGGAIMDKAVV